MNSEQKEITYYLSFKNMKPYELADKAGISRPTIYRFLKGTCQANLATWRKIKKAMED